MGVPDFETIKNGLGIKTTEEFTVVQNRISKAVK